MTTSKPDFVFKRHAYIGSADAEGDEKFLKSCFVDTGDLRVLRDCHDARRIVVGRTGAGKSALLFQIRQLEDNVIDLPPETLSLNYISNSDVLKFFETAGVKLDIFYQLLWRHVFTVELLRQKFSIRDESSKKTFISRLRDIFLRDRAKQKAIDYLQQWGEKFWQETEYRIKEFTTKLESDLKANLEFDLSNIKFGVDAADKLTEEQRREVLYKGQRVVNDVQIKDLAQVIRLLADDIFINQQERFYILIDRLDENWAEDKIRYKLIRALIETIRSFQKIQTVKIVVAIRTDLLEQVYELTRDSGFQEEKYESLYLKVRWSREQLTELLDKRVSALIREQYTKRTVRLSDIMPPRIHSKPFIDYLLDRTFHRPRDAILFLNNCLERAEGKAQLLARDITSAEGDYSAKRLRSIHDEWGTHFPEVLSYPKILEKRDFPFKIRSISRDDIDAFAVELCADVKNKADPIYLEAQKYLDGTKASGAFLNYLFRTLHKLGIVGIKTDSFKALNWYYLTDLCLHEGEVKPTSSIYVHPTFWRVLGIRAEVLKSSLEDIN